MKRCGSPRCGFGSVPYVLVLSAALLLPGATSAQSTGGPDPLDEEWRWSHFTAASGAPTARVIDITSSASGVVWIQTARGLAWFDGFSWQRPSPHPRTRIERLKADIDGGMLAITSGELWRGGEEGFRRVTLPEGLEDVEVRDAVAFGDADELLIASDSLMYLLRDGSWQPFPGPGEGRRSPESTLVRSGLGRIWLVSTATGEGSFVWGGSAWETWLPYRSHAVHESEEGGFLAVNHATDVNGIWSWSAGDPVPTRLEGEGPSLVSGAAGRGPNAAAAYRSGRVRMLRDGTWSWLATVPRYLENAHLLHYDAMGDLWSATDRGLALHRASERRWTRSSSPGSESASEINAIALGPDVDLWMATPDGLYIRNASGDVERIEAILGQRLGVVTGLARGPDGSMWVTSGADWQGAYRWRDGRWRHYGVAEGLLADRVHGVTADRQGRLWFLGLAEQPGIDETGAFVFDGETFSRWGENGGLPSARMYAFAQGPDGSLWFGTAQSLSRWSDGEWTHWTTASGLQSPRVYTIATAAGRTWFGHLEGGGGLGYIDESDEIGYLTTADGLADGRVWDLESPDGETLWVGTAGGVSRYAAGRFATFDRASGLEHPRVWPVLPTDDRVYIGTTGGGVYELSLEDDDAPPPRVLIEVPHIDGDRVTTHWTAVAYRGRVPPEAIETRSRLDGGAWSAWSTSREVDILGVSHGDHRLEVEAKGLFGAVAPQPAAVAFRVPPPLLRHPLVVSMTLLWLATGFGFGAVQWRRRHEQRRLLERSEHRLRRLVEEIPICIHEIDLEGRLLSMNPAGLSMLGLSTPADVVGRPYLESVVEEDRRRVESLMDRAREGEGSEFTFRASGPGGSTKVFGSSFVPLRDESGRVTKLMGYTRDLTARERAEAERRRLEETLRQVQKMEAVGQLAGGVAHDFNNLLTIIGGYASILAEDAPTDPDTVRDNAEQILEAHERASTLTRQLLAFGRRQILKPRVVDVGASLHTLEGMLRRLISEDLTLVFRIAEDLAPATVDPAGIEQVVINLVVNARDAVGPGGEIRISAFNRTLDGVLNAPTGSLPPGDYVVIEVEDDGMGMDAETLARVFEPFFTTKPSGLGTGLGLSTAYGIVAQSGGLVCVSSDAGQGSRFSVYLPRSTDEPSPTERTRDTPDAALSGTETILVAEDDDAVRDFVRMTLERFGYTVVSARNGAEAAALSSTDQRIDALLTDLIMPELNGRELAERFRRHRPAAPVLYMSGYADERVLGKGPQPVVDLHKPFSPTELVRKIRSILDERPAP